MIGRQHLVQSQAVLVERDVHCPLFKFFIEVDFVLYNIFVGFLDVYLKCYLSKELNNWLLKLLFVFDFQYTSISEKDINELQDKYEDLLAAIRPNAVGIVDAFDIRDEVNHAYSNIFTIDIKFPT